MQTLITQRGISWELDSVWWCA